MSILQSIISFIFIMGFVFGIIGSIFYFCERKPEGYMAEMDCKAHNEKLLRELKDLKGEITMSERMNKEQAKMSKDEAKQELERLKEISKRFLEQNNFREFKNVVIDKSERIMIGKECFYLSPKVQQALGIAIDSLDNTMTNREYMHLVGVKAILDTKFDLDKPLEKDFVKFLYALNQVEKG